MAYLAGFIDGDGSIGSYRKPYTTGHFQVRLTISQRKSEYLDWLVETFSRAYIRRRTGNDLVPGVMYSWVASSALSRDILTHILPYLRGKRPQAEVALQIVGPPRPSKERQAELAQQLKDLKH